MSSSQTDLTSTTASSTSLPSPPDPDNPAHPSHESRPTATTAVIACGAISQPCMEIVERRAWDVDVHPLPPLLHNRPDLIAGEVEMLATALRERYDTVAV